jgi:hypothetical protein
MEFGVLRSDDLRRTRLHHRIRLGAVLGKGGLCFRLTWRDERVPIVNVLLHVLLLRIEAWRLEMKALLYSATFAILVSTPVLGADSVSLMGTWAGQRERIAKVEGRRGGLATLRNRAHQEAEEVELGARPFCAAAGLIAVCNEATTPAVGAAAAAMNMSARPDARKSADVVIPG